MIKECNSFLSSRGVVFDLDGTLIDSVDSHIKSWLLSFERIAGRKASPDEIRKLVGLSGKDIVRHILGVEGLKRYGAIRWVKDKAFLSEIREGKVELFPGVLKLLRELRMNGKLIGIATSAPTYMAIHIIEYFKIFKFVDEIVCGDEVRKGKPDPEIFLKSIRKLGISPAEAVVIGDTLYDVLPALSINAKAILVNNDHLKSFDTYNHGRLQAFSNISSLLACFKSSKQ